VQHDRAFHTKMTAEPPTPPLTLYVDTLPFEAPSPTMSGSQIKALVGKDLQYQLFLEGPSNAPDELIADDYSVRLGPGMRFYTVPPAVFGGRG